MVLIDAFFLFFLLPVAGYRDSLSILFNAQLPDLVPANLPRYLVQEFLEATTTPPAKATFQYGFRGRHSWIGHSPVEPDRQMTYAEFISVISDYVTRNAPQGADTKSWKY